MNPTDDSPSNTEDRLPVTEQLIEAVTSHQFKDWYQKQQAEQNIRDGKAYYNTPSPSPDANRHSPSKLVQCHRKLRYSEENAPEEGASPNGLFWIGSKFEEEIVVPYFQSLTTEDTYVQNSLWIDTTLRTGDSEELQIRGSTDPVFVTEDGDPLLVTEVKTTSALDRMTAPRKHHKAQLHAYLHGLNKEYDYPIQDGVVLYGDRTDFDVKVFHVSFDSEFWADVVEWMQVHTQYRRDNELPPADPVFSWECDVCSYKHRCGQAYTSYSDQGFTGLLPLFTEYRKQQVVEYLDAHPDEKLTPTLAHQYPELAEDYPVQGWYCSGCGATTNWNDADWSGDPDNSPVCSDCANNGTLRTLTLDQQ